MDPAAAASASPVVAVGTAPSASSLEPAPPGRERVLQVLLLLSTLLPFVLFGLLGLHAWESGRHEAVQRLDRVARAAQEHASKVLDTNEMLLGRVLDLVGPLGDAEMRARGPELHARLTAMAAALPQVQSIWVESAQGRPMLTNRYEPPPERLNVADRDFFVFHRDGGRGLFVSAPSIGRVTNEPFFDTSRRRPDVDGRFNGIVHVSLRPEYFTRLYADLAQAELGLAVSLLRRDGLLLARWPPVEGSVAPPARSDPDGELMRRVAAGEPRGVVDLRSPFDGQARVVAFRVLDGYPLLVAAGLGERELAAAWRREMASVAALLFPLSGALVAVAWVALQRARRERAALARVRREVEHRLRAEQALLKAQKLQALGQITGSVAHDFNNLLAVINNCAHVILRRAPGADATPQARAIERAVRTGAHLTRQLLALSRRQALQPVELDLAASLPRTAELLRTSVSGRVQVEMSVQPGLDAVHVDPADLELALLNLVLNARDAMPEGGSVRVSAANVSDDDGTPWVEIAVEDTGCGIAPDVIDRVFEPFFSTKPETNGTGLGLSQVRAACEQAGGRVAIESRPGQGTTVRMRLPGYRPRVSGRPLRDELEPLHGLLLLVEDEPDVAETTRALLETLGAQVEIVLSAAAAVQRLAELRRPLPDLVLTDVAMPGMTGLALARRLRAERPELPVVLMTGFTSEIGQATAEGYTVVAKPCEPAVLARALKEALRQPLARVAG